MPWTRGSADSYPLPKLFTKFFGPACAMKASAEVMSAYTPYLACVWAR
jgi:hypothetical protein